MGLICGILGKNDPGALDAMVRAMQHRGEAVQVQSGRNYAVAASSEPVPRTPCLVDGAPRNQDGAPYTPKTLRNHCLAAGGPADLDIKGPFAAAFKGKLASEWWFLRDRLGAKPLYYYPSGHGLVFASELKGLLASGLVPKRINLPAVDAYLTLRCVPGADSIIQGVRRVTPGHALVYRDGSLEETSFARFEVEPAETTRLKAATRIEILLRKAVQRAPAGGLLWSGGIDCASLATLDPGRRLIHVSLQRAWQHEGRLARESARLLNLALETRKAKRLSDTGIRRALYHLDEPIADVSVLPLWLIVEQAAKGQTTLMSGYGADELLGGYPRYHFADKAQGRARRLVPMNLLSALLPALPPNAFIQHGSQFLTRIGDNLESYLSLLAVFDLNEREELYTEAMKAVIHEHGGSAAIVRRHFEEGDVTASQLALDLSVTLPGIGMAQHDRIAAAHGVTLDFPFLDDALVDLVTTLPPKVKFGVRSKPLLRMAMTRLPARIRMRARRGFHIPQEGQVMRVVEQFAEHTLTPERVEASGLFRWPTVERIMRTHSHNIYRRRQFWSLLMFFGWYREVMES